MKDSEKKIDEIIEETMKDIFDDVKDEMENSEISEVDGEDLDSGDIEFVEIELEDEPEIGEISEDDGDDVDDTDDVEEEGAEDDVEDANDAEEDVEDDIDEDDADGDVDDIDDTDDAEEDAEDDIDDEEEYEETEAERELRLHRRRRKAGIIVGSILGVLAVIYIGVSIYFGSHFIFKTTINGTDVSMKSVEQVEEAMKQQVADYELVIEKSDHTEEKIDGTAISLEYVPGNELKNIMKKQKNFFWIEALWKQPKIKAHVGVKFDEESLVKELEGLQCLVAENQTPSVNAHPEFKETQFEIVPEVIGTQIDVEKFNAAVKEHIDGFQPVLNLTEEGCYIQPKFFEKDKAVSDARDAMNSYLGAEVTYDFNPHTEVVNAETISQWVKVDGEMQVTFDQDAVKAYIASLAEKYDTIGKTREFTTANGNVVSVNPATYGWEIDQETEYANLIANIQNAEVVTREPAYFSRAAVHDTMDMGNTYVEVDLTAQHMWYFQNGQVALSTDVVTGNPNIGNRATPSGVYEILEKLSPTTLVGEIQPETGKPEYKTKVDFWMRVTWSGIGFHDATWQPAFGGSLYQTIGSHGCINMPYGQAQALYGMLEYGTPVIIHY